jgi:thymidylate kinase
LKIIANYMSEILNKPLPATAVKTVELIPKLALIKNLLDAFHVSGINYCHWKSNEHLDASMTADTDLDILFDEKQKERLLLLLDKLGFKKFNSIRQKQYKDIEDYIGLDFPSGKIVHLHTHFRLTMGEAYLKGYQLNLEDKILSRRVFDETFGIYRTDPAFEMILLYFREALKIRNRDIAKMYLKNKVNYTGNILKEYKWLKQYCSDQEMEGILKSIFVNYQPIYQLVTGEFNRRQLLKLSVLLKKEFKRFRLFSPLQALLLRWFREISITVFKKSSKLLNRPIVSQRINPRGGLVIAVIGADGSGKSTVIANLQSTFRKKLDVYRIYLGKGKADVASWPRKLLLMFKKKLNKTEITKQSEAPKPIETAKQNNKPPSTIPVKEKGFKANLFKCIEALIVAREKRKKLKQMHAAKRKGMLVICDRFPQNQIMGYNDGPVLHSLSTSKNLLFRIMAKMEARVYAYAEKNPPDIVFKLVADAKIIEIRKPSKATLQMLEAKIEGIKQLKFSEVSRVVTVDATQPLDKVLFTIKKEIWEAYP